MFRIKTLNNIAPVGLKNLADRGYEYGSEVETPDAIVVRSAKMHEMELPESLKAIARAGAGVNNIPVERCTEQGVVVFNTPGANANGVKELVIAGLLLSSRQIAEGVAWVNSIADRGSEIKTLVEQEKSRFAGPEIQGKTLGVIGLGAIGVMVANAATALGMQVVGYDPYISVQAAWGLSRTVQRANSLDELLGMSDYLTLHAPLTDNTRNLIGAEELKQCKNGVRILNFARDGLVNEPELLKAVHNKKVACYVTDFPTDTVVGKPGVVPIPHLGASTPESEDNCAVMATQQIADFLEYGNTVNSVNFPDCYMEPTPGLHRLIVANRNVPNMIGQITSLLAKDSVNIEDFLNRHRGELAYNIIDIDKHIPDSTVEHIAQIDGVILARRLY